MFINYMYKGNYITEQIKFKCYLFCGYTRILIINTD